MIGAVCIHIISLKNPGRIIIRTVQHENWTRVLNLMGNMSLAYRPKILLRHQKPLSEFHWWWYAALSPIECPGTSLCVNSPKQLAIWIGVRLWTGRREESFRHPNEFAFPSPIDALDSHLSSLFGLYFLPTRYPYSHKKMNERYNIDYQQNTINKT